MKTHRPGAAPALAFALIAGWLGTMEGASVAWGQTTVDAATVMVLCPEGLPPQVPDCKALAQALDMEVEDLSMHAVTGPAPSTFEAQLAAGAPAPGAAFVVWADGVGTNIVLHVRETGGNVEIVKALDLTKMDEFPAPYDIAVLVKNLMGTSLYADLASIEGVDAMMSLAVPADKEGIILERAVEGKGGTPLPPEVPKWAPQFVMGWSLLMYPGVHNTDPSPIDTYSGIMLGMRFPLPKRLWAGAAIVVTQTLKVALEYDSDGDGAPEGIGSVRNDEVAISLDVGWQPVVKRHFAMWLSLGPGILRTSTRLRDASSAAAWGAGLDTDVLWRMTLGGAASMPILISR